MDFVVVVDIAEKEVVVDDGLGIYFAPVIFPDGNTIADHVQWSIDGIDNPIADQRSDEAEAGGVWTDQSTWVVTHSDSTSIMLIEAANGLILHGPSDYIQVPEPRPTEMCTLGVVGLIALARRRRTICTERPRLPEECPHHDLCQRRE